MDEGISATQELVSPIRMTALPHPTLKDPPPLERERPTAARVPSTAFNAALQKSISNFEISLQFFKKEVVPRAINEQEQTLAYNHIKEIKDTLDREFVMTAPALLFGGKRKTRRRKIARRRR